MNKNKRFVIGTSFYDNKEIVIYDPERNKDGNYKCYCLSKKHFILTPEQKSFYRTPSKDSPYIIVRKNEKDIDLKHLSIRKQCKAINKEAKKLLKLTDGKINLYRTGGVSKTALQLWYHLDNPPIADDILEDETRILEKCRGAFMYGFKYKGKGYKYDIVSEYPYLYISKQHKYPYKRGELKILSKQEFDELNFFKFGIYHVIVENTDSRVFRHNEKHWYTHTDLNYAKDKLNAKLTLIEDNETNCLLYSADKLITGNKLFGKFVNFLFPLKRQGFKEVKKYLNCLWGTLCQINTMTISDNKIYGDKNIVSITPGKNGKHRVETVKMDKYYELPYARIKPFLFSYGRHIIAKIIYKNLDNVLRCHTDGILLKEPIKDVQLGTDLGDLKFEGVGYCEIYNNTQYKWIEDKKE